MSCFGIAAIFRPHVRLDSRSQLIELQPGTFDGRETLRPNFERLVAVARLGELGNCGNNFQPLQRQPGAQLSVAQLKVSAQCLTRMATMHRGLAFECRFALFATIDQRIRPVRHRPLHLHSVSGRRDARRPGQVARVGKEGICEIMTLRSAVRNSRQLLRVAGHVSGNDGDGVSIGALARRPTQINTGEERQRR